MKTGLALTIALISFVALDAKVGVVENAHKCRVAHNFRQVFDDAHNKLRLEKGLKEMVYDCEFEEEAAKEAKEPGYAEKNNHSKLNFTRTYETSVVQELIRAFYELRGDAKALRLMTHPKATRFGCWGILGRDRNTKERKTIVTCVYDKKPKKKTGKRRLQPVA